MFVIPCCHPITGDRLGEVVDKDAFDEHPIAYTVWLKYVYFSLTLQQLAHEDCFLSDLSAQVEHLHPWTDQLSYEKEKLRLPAASDEYGLRYYLVSRVDNECVVVGREGQDLPGIEEQPGLSPPL